MSAHVRDEHGNPIQLTDQHGNPVYLTDERGRPMHLTGVATAVGSSDVVVTHEYDTAVIKQRPEEPYQQHQLNRSGSSSSSSSEDDGQGGRRKKKGLTEKIKEKLPGKNKEHQHKEEHAHAATATDTVTHGGATFTTTGGHHPEKKKDPATALPAKSFQPFIPQDNYLFDCGSNSSTVLPGNRTFQPDNTTTEFLAYDGKDIQVSGGAEANANANVNASPIYRSAKVFATDATYTFPITAPGWHWIRLHFFALNASHYDLKTAKFTVETDKLVLLHQFELQNDTSVIMKEFLVNVTEERFPLKFKPKGTVAFVNAIEFVSAPNPLIDEYATLLFPVSQKFELSTHSFQTVYRLNVGGPEILTDQDSLQRIWHPDTPYLDPRQMGKNVAVSPAIISYPEVGGSPLTAPPLVYASALELADSKLVKPNFNITWRMDVNVHFWYLIRLHFCDIVSKSLNELYFNVYINDNIAISGLDLSALTRKLATAYYKDIVVNSTMVSSPLEIKISPVDDEAQGTRNAILNGVEVFKMNNSVGSLDGEFGVDGTRASDRTNGDRQTVAAVGFAMMFGSFVGLGAMAVKWRKRPQDWRRRSSFSSWLLPVHSGDATFTNPNRTPLGSRQSLFFSSTTEFGRYFSFSELQEATNNWETTKIIGIGGFGSVYLGLLPRDQMNLAEWAMQWKRKGLLEKIIDPTLVGHINPESMRKFAEAAEKCLAEYGVDRPTMGDVLWNLEYALQLQEASAMGKTDEENKSFAAPNSPAVISPSTAPSNNPFSHLATE
nr:probable receptor-like protein kinase At4g39110 [Ipomoea batatas]